MPQAPSAGARASRLLAGCVALVLALAGLAFGPDATTPARAAATIQEEPGAFRIDGPTYSALVADVDGDGRRELVRITNWGIDQTVMAVEIWHEALNGAWSITGPAVQLRRGPSVEERRSGVTDGNGLVPVRVGAAARLVSWRQSGRTHVLAVVNASSPTGPESPCCLTVWEVTGSVAGPPRLTLLIDTQRGGEVAYAVDLDGDGNDELAVRDGVMAAFSVLRWTGDRFRVLAERLNAGEVVEPYLLGNSDGLPGDEIGLVGQFAEGAGYGLTRVSLRAGEIHAETVEVPSGGVLLPVPPTTGSGPDLIMFGDVDRVLTALSWPSDGDLSVVARSSRRGRPVGVVGIGANTRIMLLRTDPAALDLIAPDLSDDSIDGVRPADASKPFFGTTYSPYVGPWPDPGPGNGPAQVYGGTLIRASSEGPPEVTAMAVLPGMAPLGVLGSDRAWTALAQRTSPAAELAPQGGALLQNDDFSVLIARTVDVLEPEADGGVIRPDVVEAIVDDRPAPDGLDVLLLGTQEFTATLQAPRESVAMALTRSRTLVHFLGSSAADGSDLAISGPPFDIPITSTTAATGNVAFDAALHVITPAGHGYAARWHVRLLRAPPKISGNASFLSLGLAATISGQTDPAATVSADGRSIRAGADGRYSLNVIAGWVPRDVRVEARDPIGNFASTTVNVVAPIDYRRLPWIPIMVLLTLSAGAILFVRAPRLVSRPAPSAVEDGTLEEIDAD
jgi:hypothetical protein